MPIYAGKNMRYAHFAKICENAAISEMCSNRIKLTRLLQVVED